MATSDTKFRELLLFIAEKSEGDHRFGATKINKLLFYSDFLAYLTLGKAITGQRYQKLNNGPAPRCFLPVTEEMHANEEIAFAERTYYGKQQKRIVALRSPDLSVFTAPEIDLVSNIINDCWNRSASQMSNLSHLFVGWQLAKDGEDIPYEVALVGSRPATESEREHALELQTTAEELLSRYASETD